MRKFLFLIVICTCWSFTSFCQTIQKIDSYSSTTFPYSLIGTNDPVNDIAVLNGDEMIVDSHKIYSFKDGTSTHHVFLFLNKLILKDTLTIDLSGYINADNFNQIAKAGLTKFQAVGRGGLRMPKYYPIPGTGTAKFVTQYPELYDVAMKQTNKDYWNDGIVFISIGEIDFEKNGFLQIISPASYFPLTIGYNKIKISDEKWSGIKSDFINWRKNYSMKDVFNELTKGDITSSDQIDKMTTLFYWEKKICKDIIAANGKLTTSTLTQAIEQEPDNVRNEKEIMNAVSFRNLTYQDRPILPWSVWGNQFTILPANSEFMYWGGADSYISRQNIPIENFHNWNFMQVNPVLKSQYENASPIDMEDLYSKWVNGYLHSLQLNLVQAQINGEVGQEFAYVNKLSSLYKYTVTASNQNEYVSTLSNLLSIKKNLSLGLNPFQVNISKDLFNENFLLYTEGVTNQYNTIPTMGFVNPFNINGKSYLGLVETSNDLPNDIFLILKCSLTVDDYIQDLIKRKIESQNKIYSGIFSNFSINVEPIKFKGVENNNSSITYNEDNTLNIKLCVNKNHLKELLFQIMSSSGLTLELNWTYKKNQEYSGHFPISLLGSRIYNSNFLQYKGGSVKNTSDHAIFQIDYILDSQSGYKVAGTLQKIAPGSTLSFNDIKSAFQLSSTSNISLSDRFCTLLPDNLEQMDFLLFYLDNESTKQLIVKNDFPETLISGERQTNIQFTISYTVGNKNVQQSVTLTPRSTSLKENQVNLEILTLNDAFPDCIIEGSAFYESGSIIKFKKTYSNLQVINIDEDAKLTN